MTSPIYPDDGRASIAVDGQGYLHLCGLSDSYTGFPLDNNGGSPTYFQPTRAGAPMVSSDISDGTITRFNLAAVNTFVGLRELKGLASLGLYPNPTASYLVVDNAGLPIKSWNTPFTTQRVKSWQKANSMPRNADRSM
jgi:hypothetical protein